MTGHRGARNASHDWMPGSQGRAACSALITLLTLAALFGALGWQGIAAPGQPPATALVQVSGNGGMDGVGAPFIAPKPVTAPRPAGAMNRAPTQPVRYLRPAVLEPRFEAAVPPSADTVFLLPRPVPAAAAMLDGPADVALDRPGNLYIADLLGSRVCRLDRRGNVTTVAGNGEWGLSGDGGPAAFAQLRGPTGVAADGAGDLFIADSGNARIRKVDPAGIITTVAGQDPRPGAAAERPAASLRLGHPTSVAVDAAGALFVTDTQRARVWKVNRNGRAVLVAGTGHHGWSGDGGAAVDAMLDHPTCAAFNPQGDLFIADAGNRRIRKVNARGVISTVAILPAGSGRAMARPSGLAVDTCGNLYVADSRSCCIWRLQRSCRLISRVGQPGLVGRDFGGDGGPASLAELSSPCGLALAASGDLFFVDRGNRRIRCVSAGGIIRTVVGTGPGEVVR